MGEFFKGWRRKAGLVTLVMACLLMVAWMRSYGRYDEVRFSLHSISSDGGALLWGRHVPATGRRHILDTSENAHVAAFVWYRDWGGFRSEHRIFTQPNVFSEHNSWTIPYWSLVLPLTLLSAWLILVTPRNEKRTQAPIDSRSQEGQ